MLTPIRVLYWAEGPTDLAVARKLIRDAGGVPGPEYSARSGAAPGKGRLDKKLAAFNEAARMEPFLVLRDFDFDASCPGDLVAELLGPGAPFMCFRIAVPQIEAWLMSDTMGISDWLGIDANLVPRYPERLQDAKSAFLRLVESSRRVWVQREMLPARGSGRRTGPRYTYHVIEFIDRHWDMQRSLKSAKVPSLSKAHERLKACIVAYRTEQAEW